jgi:hypothetical protein
MKTKRFKFLFIRNFIASVIKYKRWRAEPKNIDNVLFIEEYSKIK